jgi:hypothetical protein
MMIALSKASNSLSEFIDNKESQTTVKLLQIRDRNTALDSTTQAQQFIVKRFLEGFPLANLGS